MTTKAPQRVDAKALAEALSILTNRPYVECFQAILEDLQEIETNRNKRNHEAIQNHHRASA